MTTRSKSQYSVGLLSIALLFGLAACSGQGDSDNAPKAAAIPTAKEVVAKYFPALSATPVFSPAAPGLDQDFTLTIATERGGVTSAGGGTTPAAYLVPVTSTDGSSGSLLLQLSNGTEFKLSPFTKNQVKPVKYTVTLPAIRGIPTAEGYTPTSTYRFDPALSTTHYVLMTTCQADGVGNMPGKCIPEFVDFGSGAKTAQQWADLGDEISKGIVSEIALPFLTVGASSVDFSAVITGVTWVSVTLVNMHVTLKNAGTSAGTARYAVWGDLGTPPAVKGTANNYADQPLGAGETLHLTWANLYSPSSSGNSYTAYVLIDQIDNFLESNEADNLGSFGWSAP